MEIIHTIADLQQIIKKLKENKESIGFVPTMGALHAGHLELVKRSVAENDSTLVSIFVNPTQFNDANDLLKYPRTIEQDIKMLEEVGCKFAFIPEEKEMYPEKDTRVFEFGNLENILEGSSRPGHFNGVAQIVSKLFELVQPDKAYFGEKDFQQLAIVRKLVRQMNYPVKIVGCPIIREEDGLAMSSRNTRLSSLQRNSAPRIYETLVKSKSFFGKISLETFKKNVINTIEQDPNLKVDYFEIVHANNLEIMKRYDYSDCMVGCIAVICGEIRLIDNIIYNK